MASKQDKKKLCFVVGPIGSEDSETRTHADWLLEEIIQPVMADFPDFQVKRADQDHRPGLIDAQLINDLLTAELVIADLSGLNPNAFYEIGIRHMAQKPIIHMQLAAETIPFDVSLYRAIKFSRARPRDLRAAKEALKAQVDAVLANGYQTENPVTHARGRIQLDEHATPEMRVLSDEIAALRARMEKVEVAGTAPITALTPADIDRLLTSSRFDVFAGSDSVASTPRTLLVKTHDFLPDGLEIVSKQISEAIPNAQVRTLTKSTLNVSFSSTPNELSMYLNTLGKIRAIKAIRQLRPHTP